MVERKKSSVYLDPAVLRAVKIRAAREDKPEYLVVEEALRRHLGMDLFERLRAQGPGMDETEAMELAVTESKRARRAAEKKPRT